MAKKILAVLLCLAMVFAFAACASKSGDDTSKASDSTSAEAGDDTSKASDSTSAEAADDAATVADLDAVKAAGKLVVGITDFAPMDYQEKGSDEWVGFDADMAKAFAKSLGVEVEFVEIEWDNKILELNNKNIDCVWNGMTLTDEVTSSMDCSKAYCNNAQVVVVKADVADKYQKAEDCKELAFAVESGSAGETEAKNNGFENVTPVKDQASALMEVKAGTCDAAIIDSLMAAAMVGEGTDYADLTYTASLNSEEYGVGFRQGSDLVAALDQFFADSKADGSMAKIAETYGVQAALIAD